MLNVDEGIEKDERSDDEEDFEEEKSKDEWWQPSELMIWDPDFVYVSFVGFHLVINIVSSTS